MLPSLAPLAKLSIAQDMETASRYEKLQHAAWSRLVRERGSVGAFCEELLEINRDRLHQCAQHQQPAVK